MARFTDNRIILILISAVAAYCIIGVQIRNGFFDLLYAAGKAVPRKLPGSTDTVIANITGFNVIDKGLGELLMFFWPVLEAESPSLSLFAVYMVGQILPVQTLVLLEGLRSGNSGKIISYTAVWGILSQSIPWGIVMPIYFALYLGTSPITRTASLSKITKLLSIDPVHLAVLPVSLSLGFIIPTVLVAVPSPILASNSQRQVLLIFWQGFPIWIALCQCFLTNILWICRPSSKEAESPSPATIKLFRRVYTFSLSFAALAHVTTVSLASFSALQPNYFFPASAASIDLKTVFLPMPPLSTDKVELLTQGCLYLLQYDMYFACGAAIIWAVTSFNRLYPKPIVWDALIKAFILSLLLGPGGAALALVWQRDEKVFDSGKNDKINSRKGQ